MEQFVSIETGVRMEYVEQGPPRGLPLIFLHGVTDSWHSFERVLELLPPGVHAFALSQRGHGDSSRPASGYRFSDFSGDLLAFMNAMDVPSAIVVGHSMGASVAQRFAIDHPDRLAALVLMGAFADFTREPAIAEFYASEVAPLRDPISPEFARAWQLSTLAQRMPEDHLDRVVAETLKVRASVWHAAFQGFLDTPDFTSGLRHLARPVLLVWGDRDTYAAGADQERLLESIPGARLIVYEGHGHALHWEDPLRFTADLVRFVSDVSGRHSGHSGVGLQGALVAWDDAVPMSESARAMSERSVRVHSGGPSTAS